MRLQPAPHQPLRLALAWLDRQRLRAPRRSVTSYVDEAAARFDLTPTDQRRLRELLALRPPEPFHRGAQP